MRERSVSRHPDATGTRSLVVDGIHVRAAGEHGTAVLLLHGIGGSSESFDAQLAGLARNHRVFAWDAPGYGSSADPDESLGMAGYANRVVGLLDGLGLDRAHVVGVSWGGVIATRMALSHADRMQAMVLADSTRGSALSYASAQRMLARAGQLAELGARRFACLRGPRLTAPDADPAVVARVVDIMSAIRPYGYAAAAASMAETDHSHELARVTVPTLVVVGEHDGVTGVAESAALAAGIPTARLKVIAGGHAANQEHPDQFDAAVLEFLSGADTAGAA